MAYHNKVSSGVKPFLTIEVRSDLLKFNEETLPSLQAPLLLPGSHLSLRWGFKEAQALTPKVPSNGHHSLVKEPKRKEKNHLLFVTK